jgi:hypothetical protein
LALLFDLVGRTEGEASKNGDRRTPALHGVLEQKSRDQGGNSQPTSIPGRLQRDAGKSEGRGIGLARSLDIPFLVQLAQAAGNFVSMLLVVAHPFLNL